MQAMVFYEAEELVKIDIRDRFEFEDRFLKNLVQPRPCEEYKEHQPSPKGVHVFLHPGSQEFQARPYLEFAKHVHNQTHFHVMQEGQPTGFEVVLG